MSRMPEAVSVALKLQITDKLGQVSLVASGIGLFAARPAEINFVNAGGIRGRVLRKAFLGETIDYRIMVGDTQVRVQKTRQVPGPAVGGNCGLEFACPHWYPVD